MVRRILLGSALAIVVAMALTGPTGTRRADAHPLGNFTINHLAKVSLTEGKANVRYIVDMAEIPAFQEIRKIDKDSDGSISDAEGQAYLKTIEPQIAGNLELKTGSTRVNLTAGDGTIGTLDGQGGLKTLRIAIDYSGELPATWTEGVSATFKDSNYSDRLGWRDVIVTAGPGVALTESNAITVDETDELTVYPESRLKSPPDVRQARFKFQPGEGTFVPATTKQHSGGKANAPTKSLNGFAGLVSKTNLTPAFIALSMLAAIAWGAAHALGPGHGKTIVVAYLVGEKGTAKHAAILGLTVTLTHTSTVFALGIVTLSFAHLINTEDVFLWLSVGSGLMVVVMGLVLLLSRLRIMLRSNRASRLTNRMQVLSAPHANPNVQVVYIDGRNGAHSHGSAAHSHDAAGTHDHGFGSHSHAPPTAPGIKGLIALGISGGLLPCPTALVVMLGAIALDRTTYGLALVLAFSFGLAGVLTGIGLVMVYARRFFEGTSSSRRIGFLSPTLMRGALAALPVISSLAIVAAGVLITSSALAAV